MLKKILFYWFTLSKLGKIWNKRLVFLLLLPSVFFGKRSVTGASDLTRPLSAFMLGLAQSRMELWRLKLKMMLHH